MDLELEKVRGKGKDEISRLVDEYLGAYEKFSSFITKIDTFPKFSPKDKAVLSDLSKNYVIHKNNLENLKQEFAKFNDYSDYEQNVLFELTPEIIGKAAKFILELPGVIKGTAVGE